MKPSRQIRARAVNSQKDEPHRALAFIVAAETIEAAHGIPPASKLTHYPARWKMK